METNNPEKQHAGMLALVPAAGFVRLSQIIGDRTAHPPLPGLIPISKSQWWEWVRCGRAPAPIKLGPATTVWRAEEIRELIDRLAAPADDDQPPSEEMAGSHSSRGARLTEARRKKRERHAA